MIIEYFQYDFDRPFLRFKGGGSPPPPPPPPATPEAPEEVGDTERKRAARRKGRKQTFLTGDLIPETEQKTLLGGN